MSLTTPVQRDRDVVLPGENWFFYWKTSASLWESKLEQISANKVIIPINWSFHSETGVELDFAGKRPETDLKRLFDLVILLNKEAIFLLPISPVPFLPNGGVPHLLARNLSLDKYGMVYTISDGNNNFNKLYSFFDTRIFKSYSKFVKDLGNYFSQSGIAGDVYGLDSGYLEEGYFHSYFYDNSRVFTNAFSNYLMAKKELESDETNNIEDKVDNFISNPEREFELKSEFRETIYNFYIKTAEKALLSNWVSCLKVTFIGAQTRDFISRIYGKECTSDYVKNIFESMTINTLASSTLVDGKKKEKVLGRVLEDLISNTFSNRVFNELVFDEVNSNVFKPLVLFNILYNNPITKNDDCWKENFLVQSLYTDFKWQYKQMEITDFENMDLAVETNQLFFISGEKLTKESFNKMLKTFLNGGSIIIDNYLMDTKLLRRLQLFIIENSLQVEKINFLTEIEHAFLGVGRLVIFNGEKLRQGPSSKICNFWKKIISTFDFPYLKINCPEEIEYFWRTRDSNSKELNYEEIRRINFYNPSSYKKKVTLYLQKNFALMKIIDERHVNVRTNNYEVEVELLPEGSVSLDFGMYSE